MLNLLHVHVPFTQLQDNLPFLLERRLQPEIAIKGPDLDLVSPVQLRQLAQQLSASGLACTIHAPFMDLNPGALEPLVFAATQQRFTQTLDMAETLGARLIVFHPGYDPWKYGGQDHLWLEQNLRFWPPLLARAAQFDCILALENIFEVRPDTLFELLVQIHSPFFGHCFDIGHWNLFSVTTLNDWFAVLGSRMVHLHLHDNFGKRDDHLPIGEGNIDFSTLFSLLGVLPLSPSITLESHSQSTLLRSCEALYQYLRVESGSDLQDHS